MAGFAIAAIMKAWGVNHPTAHEEPYVALGTVPTH
jgi:carbon starvation protein